MSVSIAQKLNIEQKLIWNLRMMTAFNESLLYSAVPGSYRSISIPLWRSYNFIQMYELSSEPNQS